MAFTNFTAATLNLLSNFDATAYAEAQGKFNAYDTALTAMGAPSAQNEIKTSGALSLGVLESFVSVTGTVAFTLADGTVAGQRKVIECTVAASTPQGTLTITTPMSGEPATHVFNATGQRLELEWCTIGANTGWHITRKVRAGTFTTTVGTTVLTGFDMNRIYDTSVTGTVSSTGTKAIPDPTVGDEGAHILVTCSTAASTPNGSIDGTFSDNANANKTHLSVSATTNTALFVACTGRWHQVLLNGSALS